MTQAEMRSDAPPPIDWAHQVQELINLVEAVRLLTDSDVSSVGRSPPCLRLC
jgi:hypothetical protein